MTGRFQQLSRGLLIVLVVGVLVVAQAAVAALWVWATFTARSVLDGGSLLLLAIPASSAR